MNRPFLVAKDNTAMDRAPLGAVYAADVKVRNRRIYFRLGNTGVADYDADTFLARIDRGDALGYPFTQDHGNSPEQLLTPDNFFNVYSMHSVGNADALGAEALKDFDVDNTGAIYVAAIQGWAILLGGRIVFQDNSMQVGRIIALRGTSKRYALVSGPRPALYDVTNRSAPVGVTSRVPQVQAFAKSADESRVAIVDFSTRRLSVYSADGLATGAAPIYSGGICTSVTTDGTNFYALSGTFIDAITPFNDTYMRKPAGAAQMMSPQNINYGDGRIVVSGSDNGSWAWRILKVTSDGTLEPVPFDASATVNNQQINAYTGTVYNGRPILCGKARGDVYDKLEGAAQPVTVPPVAVPPAGAAPNFDDQQTWRAAIPAGALFVIRDSEAKAVAGRDNLLARGVTHAEYRKLAPSLWIVFWY